ncbi:FG-GAP-like repeat-containing protein [Sphingomonas sp. NSE70-1]|uniref:FG-GAP-like repeat-containing protein n=1 Tax=Sphingomonas caseinilyticus TaxID=2908205 RepID=A0ABT0RS35_9SPHN|nr:FG-GAP-like repeat-containing protein [Sphingomonas caseinilyticus]
MGVTVNLSIAGPQNVLWDNIDTLVSIESIIGSISGNDTLVGDGGSNRLDGMGGNDTLRGGEGDDFLNGGAGNDTLLGEGGDDVITDSDAGNDILDGGAGNDFISLYRLDSSLNEAVTIRGGDGNDMITAWSYASGSVVIDAGAGDDSVSLVTSNNSQQITLGTGRDVLNLDLFQPIQGAGQTSRIVTDFQTGAVGDSVLMHQLLSRYGEWDGQSNPFEAGVIRLVQRGADAVLQMSGIAGVSDFQDVVIFQNVSTGSFVAENFGGFSPNGVPAAPTNLTGDGADNTLNGGYGEDIINGLGGDDTIDGSTGNDILRGGDGYDTIRPGQGNDVVEGGAGNDFIDLYHDGGSDSVDAGTGNDWIRVYRTFRDVSEDLTIIAGDGDDQLTYQNFDRGTLTASLGSGADLFIILGARQDIKLTLGANADIIDLSQNDPTLIGEMLITIADYVPGEDHIEWGYYLQNQLIGWDGQSNPFTSGYLQLEQQAGKVVLSIDRDGSSDSTYAAAPFLVLENVSLSSLSSADFAGHSPASDARNDFNGDGRSDILWRNDNGQMTNWLGEADGGFAYNDANAANVIATDWRIAGVGDFNGDGRDDILWRRDNGQMTNWLGEADGGFAYNDANAANVIATDWHIAGVGDFNGDGRDDILWRRDNGQMTNWLGEADGGFAYNDANAANVIATDWRIAGVGDFNGDGRDDILWRRDNGQMTNWLGEADGGFAYNDANAANVIATDWHVQPSEILWM